MHVQGFCFSINIMYKLSCKKSGLHYICTNKLKVRLLRPWYLEKHFGSKLTNRKRGQLSVKIQKSSIVSNFSKSWIFEYLNVIGQFSNSSTLGHGPPFDHRPSTKKTAFAGRSDVVDVLLVFTSRSIWSSLNHIITAATRPIFEN